MTLGIGKNEANNEITTEYAAPTDFVRRAASWRSRRRNLAMAIAHQSAHVATLMLARHAQQPRSATSARESDNLAFALVVCRRRNHRAATRAAHPREKIMA